MIFVQMFFQKNKKGKVSEDIMFFKSLLNSKSDQELYKFKVDYRNMKFKTVDLTNKIAPGTKGSFDILLEANQNLNYRVEFKNINEKPKNLKFSITKNNERISNINCLEDVSNSVKGEIRKNEKIKITVDWHWDFFNNEFEDIEDTRDGMNIETYKFWIYVVGEEEG